MRVRDIQAEFLRANGFRPQFSKANGWTWAGRGLSPMPRDKAFKEALRGVTRTERRKINARLSEAVSLG